MDHAAFRVVVCLKLVLFVRSLFLYLKVMNIVVMLFRGDAVFITSNADSELYSKWAAHLSQDQEDIKLKHIKKRTEKTKTRKIEQSW